MVARFFNSSKTTLATARIFFSRRISLSFAATSSRRTLSGGSRRSRLRITYCPAGRDDLRHLAVGQGEGRLLDLLVGAVPADRLDQAADAGAVDVLRVSLGEVGEIFRMGGRLGPDLLGQPRIAARNQPRGHLLAVAHLEVLSQLLGSDLQPRARQAAQCQRRPDDVGGVLLHVDVPLLLQQGQPLIHRQAESLGHPLDFAVHVGRVIVMCCRSALLHDQLPVDHAVEHFLAVVQDALASEFLAGDLPAVDAGDDLRDRLAAGDRRHDARRSAGHGRRRNDSTPGRRRRRPTCQTRPAAPVGRLDGGGGLAVGRLRCGSCCDGESAVAGLSPAKYLTSTHAVIRPSPPKTMLRRILPELDGATWRGNPFRVIAVPP